MEPEPWPTQAAVLDAGCGDQDDQQQVMVSTAMCRLRPLTFLAAWYSRSARATSSAALTDWESMIAAVGAGLLQQLIDGTLLSLAP